MSHHGREGLTEEQSFGPAAPELPDRAARLAAVPLEHRAFCVYCGLGVGVDEDGCCTGCGNGVESLEFIRALLASQGLSIVSAKDRAVLTPLALEVLQACGSYVEAETSSWRRIRADELLQKAMRYELARRKP